MDTKSRYLVGFAVAVLLMSGWFSYLRFFVTRDFLLEGESECDPETERCFVWTCDPEAVSGDEACTGDSESDTWYYKIVRKNASSVSGCDPESEEGCPELSCGEGESDCEEVFCDENASMRYDAPCSVELSEQAEESGDEAEDAENEDVTGLVDGNERDSSSEDSSGSVGEIVSACEDGADCASK